MDPSSTQDEVVKYPNAMLDHIGAGIVPGHGFMVQALVLMKEAPKGGPLQVNMNEQETESVIRLLQVALKDLRRLKRVTVELEEIKEAEKYL